MVGLNTILAEKYSNVHENLEDLEAIDKVKAKAIAMFDRKAQGGPVEDKAGNKYTETLFRHALNALVDIDSVKDFIQFLGISEATPVQTESENSIIQEGKHLTPEQVYSAVTKSPSGKVIIRNHYGSAVLPVTEVWVDGDALNIAIDFSG